MSGLGDDQLQRAAPLADAVHPPAGLLTQQLPRVLAQDHFIRGYVGLCDEIWASVLERIDHLEWFLDVGVTPITFVRWLGSWLGVDVDPTLPEARQRAVVRTAGRTLMWRGTRYGLEQLLSALTGAAVEVTDDAGVAAGDDPPRVSPRVSVRLSSSGGLTETHLLELIRGEIPANAVIELEVDAEVVEAPPPEGADQQGSVLADPGPYGDEGFLPPMRGRLDDDRSVAAPQDPGHESDDGPAV